MIERGTATGIVLTLRADSAAYCRAVRAASRAGCPVLWPGRRWGELLGRAAGESRWDEPATRAPAGASTRQNCERLMLKATAILAGLGFALLQSVASAAACGQQSSANDAAFKMLQRQLSALRSIERARGCQSGDRGGFFNACREVAMKINEVQQQLGASTQTHCRGARVRDTARVATGRSVQRAPQPRAVVKQASVRSVAVAPKKRRGAKNPLQFCVRLSDGYYFPTPNSQYGQKGGAETALAQCRMICETEDMAVYVLNDRRDESADMVSVSTGQSYADLPAAYDYHGGGAFRRCNWNGYVAKVRAHLIRRHQSQLLAKLDIPLPDSRPSQASDAIGAPVFSDYQPMPERILRSVGPSFMPDASTERLGRLPVSDDETGF